MSRICVRYTEFQNYHTSVCIYVATLHIPSLQVRISADVYSGDSVSSQEMTSTGFFFVHGLLAPTAPLQATQQVNPANVSFKTDLLPAAHNSLNEP